MAVGDATRSDIVLLVHADAASRATVSGLLEANRYDVEGVASGGDGLQFLLSDDPLPCLILFILTGSEDGSQAFRTAQMADPTFAAVPIIMCSSEEFDGPGPHRITFVEALLTLVGRHCTQMGHAN